MPHSPHHIDVKRILMLTGLTLLVACASPRSQSPHPSYDAADVISGGIVVDFEDGISKADYDAIEQAWGIDLEFNSIESLDSGITLATQFPGDSTALLNTIRQHPRVEWAEPLLEYRINAVTPNDPRWEEQWNMRMINMPKAWERATGKGVVVAVLDTGVAYEDYKDFKAVEDLRDAKFAKGYNFVSDTTHANDDHGHGTHVAGTIAQVTNNKKGVAGIAYDAKIMPVKVLSRFGGGTQADIADAIRWSADNGADVINMSLGGGARSKIMENAIKYAIKKDVVVVAAAGNASRNKVEFPAAYDGVIGVSAVGPNGDLSFYSSYGKEIDIAAPGGDKKVDSERGGVLQNTIGRGQPAQDTYEHYQGTSMAAPHVAGVAALLKSVGVDKPEMVEEILKKSAKKKGKDQWSAKYGYGLLDADAALKSAGSSAEMAGTIPRGIIATILIAIITWILKRWAKSPGVARVSIVTPAYVVGALVAATGFFFLRWLGFVPGVGDFFEFAALPLADMERFAFANAAPSPLAYSAIVPVVLGICALPFRKLRGFFAGIGTGYAAFLIFAAITGTALLWFSSTFGTILWLGVNAVAALIVSWGLLRMSHGASMREAASY